MNNSVNYYYISVNSSSLLCLLILFCMTAYTTLPSDLCVIMVMQVGVIEKFAEDSELQDEIRLLGGIPLILALLR